MANTIFSQFRCDSCGALAAHLAFARWGLNKIPKGLLDELSSLHARGVTMLTSEILESLRNTYAVLQVQPPSEGVPA